ncbi:uncharacterized protein LOC141656055 [Silene latifolia]|uniref:uncharacterized protein LOC141656055 n=1 Tax=Silene latifolia TaxID=37657 RepID=UPI003D7714D9
MEEGFPSNVELTAAASLLLLSHSHSHLHPSTAPLPLPSSASCGDEFLKKSYAFIESETRLLLETTPPSRSSITSEFSQFHLQVVRKARSKVIYISTSDQKAAPSTREKPPVVLKRKAVTCSQTTSGTAEDSCLTTGGTSEISSKRKRNSAEAVEQKTRRRVGSTHIRRRAEAIIRMLSRGECASEVRIRQVLGDSPDTSKALRMLLRMSVVKRSGAGGRTDPYRYMMVATS